MLSLLSSNILLRPEVTTDAASGAALSDEARQTIYKEAYEASLYHRNERKNAEQQVFKNTSECLLHIYPALILGTGLGNSTDPE